MTTANVHRTGLNSLDIHSHMSARPLLSSAWWIYLYWQWTE